MISGTDRPGDVEVVEGEDGTRESRRVQEKLSPTAGAAAAATSSSSTKVDLLHHKPSLSRGLSDAASSSKLSAHSKDSTVHHHSRGSIVPRNRPVGTTGVKRVGTRDLHGEGEDAPGTSEESVEESASSSARSGSAVEVQNEISSSSKGSRSGSAGKTTSSEEESRSRGSQSLQDQRANTQEHLELQEELLGLSTTHSTIQLPPADL
ncbi:unnamed protein product [Amoebophrya sp. A120]|nr:unnamed protein product [Amoebophrya sp. A120]|eukprot:GSA120T00024834001.1